MDDCFWVELADLEVDDVCRRSGATHDDGSYQIRVLGRDHRLALRERQLRPIDGDLEEDQGGVDALCFAVVHYLLNARRIPLAGDLVAASELKGGKLFFAAGAHSPDFRELEEAFSASPEAMERAAVALGGRRVEHGDAAVEIQALPRVPITFVFWAADEEFPASTSMLFDRTAEKQLPLDVVLALAQETMHRLVRQAQREIG